MGERPACQGRDLRADRPRRLHHDHDDRVHLRWGETIGLEANTCARASSMSNGSSASSTAGSTGSRRRTILTAARSGSRSCPSTFPGSPPGPVGRIPQRPRGHQPALARATTRRVASTAARRNSRISRADGTTNDASAAPGTGRQGDRETGRQGEVDLPNSSPISERPHPAN
jgi:hypothetical protein